MLQVETPVYAVLNIGVGIDVVKSLRSVQLQSSVGNCSTEEAMAQVWIDIEDNDNCGYFPMQTFEVRGRERSASSILLDDVANVDGQCEAVGWSDDGRCEIRVVPVGDSGAGESILIHGGNHGIRLRPNRAGADWSLEAEDEFGEPYMLLPSGTSVEFVESEETC